MHVDVSLWAMLFRERSRNQENRLEQRRYRHFEEERRTRLCSGAEQRKRNASNKGTVLNQNRGA